MTTLENKVAESFKSEFNYSADRIVVKGIFAYAFNDNQNIEYYCKLNTRGVKKNSWRLEVYN